MAETREAAVAAVAAVEFVVECHSSLPDLDTFLAWPPAAGR